MVTFANPKSATAGDAIIANDFNQNWSYTKAWLEGVAGQEATYPGVLQLAGGTVTGALNVSGDLAVSTDVLFVDKTLTHEKVGFKTATPSTFPPAPSQRSVYNTNSHGGVAGTNRSVRAEYRIVNSGSIYVDGDIIGWTAYNDDTKAWRTEGTGAGQYELGSGTRINVQSLNVRGNADISGSLRVESRLDSAKIYMGNDYTTNEDYLEWNDAIYIGGTGIGPGFRFVHNDTPHLIVAQSAGVLSLHAQQGWPSLIGTNAVITTTGLHQLGIQSSSIRFKEDVEDLEVSSAWSKLKALRPRRFNWNEEVTTNSGVDYETQIPELGFIAEEVHEAAPDATLYDEHGDPIVYRDKSMLSLLVKAVQDLDERLGKVE